MSKSYRIEVTELTDLPNPPVPPDDTEQLEGFIREIAVEEARRVADVWMNHHLETHHSELPVPPPDPTDPPSDPEPPPDPPPGGSDPRDGCGAVDPFHAKYVSSGWWEGFWTGSERKLTQDGNFGVVEERNASTIAIADLTGSGNCEQFATRGKVRFICKINAEGIEAGGGGKHLVNIASGALSRGPRGIDQTRLEIADPAFNRPRFVSHNYVNGRGGAKDMGDLPFSIVADREFEVEFSWIQNNDELTINWSGEGGNAVFHVSLEPNSPPLGIYWGPGHMETNSGGGRFWFTRPVFSAA